MCRKHQFGKSLSWAIFFTGEVRKKRNMHSHILMFSGELQNVQVQCLKVFWYLIKIFLSFKPVISLLGVVPENTTPEIYAICTRLVTVTVTVVEKYLKLSKCPTIWGITTMEHYGTLKNKPIHKQTNQSSFLYPVLERSPR